MQRSAVGELDKKIAHLGLQRPERLGRHVGVAKRQRSAHRRLAQPDLVGRLRHAAIETSGPVGRQNHQRNAQRLGFRERRQQIGHGRA